MHHESEYEYNRRREMVERLAAEQATLPLVKLIHEDLASRYAKAVLAIGNKSVDEER